MTRLKPRSPARLGALLATALALAGGADAATIYGGGSSLIAPIHRQAGNCFGPKVTDLPARTGATTQANLILFENFGTCAPLSYTPPSTDTVQYVSTGSGVGVAGLFSHDPLLYGDINGTSPGVQQTWTSGVQYGLSDIPLTDSDVSIYNNGGAIQGVTLAAIPVAGQYPLPKPRYGALVQFPIASTAIALAYDPIYKKVNAGGTVTSYRFNVNPAFARSNGGLRLDQTTYCKIVNNQITNWNDAAITALNGGVSLKDPSDPDPFNLPIELVGQRDASGATQILTRHLAATCGGLAGNAYVTADGTPILPPSLRGPSAGGVPAAGVFTLAAGGNGVAAYASFSDTPAVGATIVRGRLGYVGADYALPSSSANGLPYTLFTADLKNAAGGYRAPTGPNATDAFSANLPPQANPSTGAYDTAQTAWGVRTNPADWVRVGDLANPTTPTAYPIVGTVNYIGYTCYASAVVNAVRTPTGGATPGYLNYWFDSAVIDGTTGILNSAGLAPLPSRWQVAIKATFVAPTPVTSPLNLFIDVVGAGSTNSTCASTTGA